MTDYAHILGQMPLCEDGDTFTECNFARLVPGVKIGLNAKGDPCAKLTFTRCNLFNCIPPDDATVIDCNTAQVSYCSHLAPELVAAGLPVCKADCEHVTSQTPVWQPATKEEFTSAKIANPLDAKMRVTTVTNAVGLVTQTVEKLAVPREHTYLGRWNAGKVETL